MQGSRYQLQCANGERQGLIVDWHGNPAVNDNGQELVGAVLDHNSITQRNFGSATVERAINLLNDHRLPIHEFVPKQVRGLAHAALMPVSELVRLFGIGEISQDIRERFDISFTKQDQRRLDDIRGIARMAWSVTPEPLLYYPVAYNARLRETGGKHNSVADRLAYTALTNGKAVAGGVFRHVRRAFTHDNDDKSSFIGNVDFYPNAS
ncbi:MAG TPA: hypothetical protein VMT96_00130 [Candidatus Bathyarchaeia archaeon]|nr:hypothetical protein [Candidatus Bathyarchaeia archaeon]